METGRRISLRWLVGAISVATLLLAAQTSAVGAAQAPQAGAGSDDFSEHWAQVNPSGFGNQANGMIGALAPFKDQLYATTGNDTGSQIWRRSGGSWSAVMTGGFGSARNAGIDHLQEFNGQLYASTGNETDGGEVWRSPSGDAGSWGRVVSAGFDRASNAEIMRFAAYSNALYASAWSYDPSYGVDVWRSATGNKNEWSRVVTNGFDGDVHNATVLSFESFNGYLFAGTLNSTSGGEVWRSASGDSGTWTQVNADGFGEAANQRISALAAYGGYLYAATHHSVPGGVQVWRCQACDGSDWTRVVNNGFDRQGARQMPALELFEDALYLAIGNSLTGLEVWRTTDGTAWEQVGFDGFGDARNRLTYFDNATTAFGPGLYIGTANYATGGQIWVFKPQFATLYVAPNGVCGGAAPCYATLQAAVDAAGDLDVIKIAAGTYTDVHVRPRNDIVTTGEVTQLAYIDKTLRITGGFTTADWTTPDAIAHPTTLDAGGQGRVLYVTGNMAPLITGLHITGGDAAQMGGDPTCPSCEEGQGGGVYIFRGAATLSHNRIYGNTANGGGGAYVVGWSGDPPARIESNILFSNTADADGAGLGLAGSSASVTDNLIYDNVSNGKGGGVSEILSGPTLERNIIHSNRSEDGGGGLAFQWGSPTLINNVIADNQVTGSWGHGGGLLSDGADAHLLHNTIARNTGGDGSGLYVVDLMHGLPTIALTNTIVADQAIGISASGVSTVTVDSVLWHNTPATVAQSGDAVVTVKHANTGNPAFASDGYHLGPDSAAMDKGISAGVTEDIDGDPRPAGPGYDLGADELWCTTTYLPLVLRAG
jgi:hypothetical protein